MDHDARCTTEQRWLFRDGWFIWKHSVSLSWFAVFTNHSSLEQPEKWFFSTFSWKDLLTNAYVTTLYISGDYFLSYSSYLSQVRFKGGEEVWVEKVFQLNVCVGEIKSWFKCISIRLEEIRSWRYVGTLGCRIGRAFSCSALGFGSSDTFGCFREWEASEGWQFCYVNSGLCAPCSLRALTRFTIRTR